MIELICRDEIFSPAELEEYAALLRTASGDEVVVHTPDDLRALVFWSVKDLRQQLNLIQDGDCVPDEWLAEYLQRIEPDIHSAMLSAGWDEILLSLDDAVDEHLFETYGFHLTERLDGTDPEELTDEPVRS